LGHITACPDKPIHKRDYDKHTGNKENNRYAVCQHHKGCNYQKKNAAMDPSFLPVSFLVFIPMYSKQLNQYDIA